MTHNNNPCLTWCAANAIIVSDPANNRKPDKAKSTGRIDGIVAAVMAVGKSLNADNFDIDSYIMGIVS
jgi:phage terminase large subunit-like protein